MYNIIVVSLSVTNTSQIRADNNGEVAFDFGTSIICGSFSTITTTHMHWTCGTTLQTMASSVIMKRML